MTHTTTLTSILESPLHLGRPSRFESLTLFPVLGPQPRITYRSLNAALHDGATVQELRDASVNDVSFDNAGHVPTLLFDGEAIQGAQQDRVIDGARLVAAGVKVTVPVCCVERGRWDGTRHSQAFAVADHVASPEVRACMKSTQRTSVEQRSDQHRVWESVGTITSRLGVRSTTGAFSHVVESQRDSVEALVNAVEEVDGQLGWLVFSGEEFVAFDLVSRPDAWCDISRRLLRGYALQLDVGVACEVTREHADAQLARLSELPLEPSDPPVPTGNPKTTLRPERWTAAKIWNSAPSLATPYRPLAASGLEGSVLAAPQEVLAVSLFAA